MTEALRAPSKISGCSGTRNLHDNLSDLRAQVAANQKGIQLVGELIGQYGLDVVQAYMGHIQVSLGARRWGPHSACPLKVVWLPLDPSPCQANAELAVRDMLRAFGTSRQARGLPLEVSAEDHMDDGSPIHLRVQINLSQVRPSGETGWEPSAAWGGGHPTAEAFTLLLRGQGSAVFDFGGTGPEVFGNLNAPRAITLSALIYCLRCLVGRDIPLNQVRRGVESEVGPYQYEVSR